MYRKRTLLIGLLLSFCLGAVLSRAVAQSDPLVGWEEGRSTESQSITSDAVVQVVPTTPGTLYRTFSGTRFQPTASAMTYAPIGGEIYATALPPGGYSFSVDFDLPPGATITEVVFFVVDNDATDMAVSLRSYNPETDSFVVLESGASSGASTALQIITLTVNPTIQVDPVTTSYRLRVAPGVASSNHLLRGARIGYTVPASYLPFILN